MPKHSSHMLELARRGAEARFRELLDELKSLTSAFPHLRDSFDRDELPLDFTLRRGRDKALAAALKARRQRSMSVAQRRQSANGCGSIGRRNGRPRDGYSLAESMRTSINATPAAGDNRRAQCALSTVPAVPPETTPAQRDRRTGDPTTASARHRFFRHQIGSFFRYLVDSVRLSPE